MNSKSSTPQEQSVVSTIDQVARWEEIKRISDAVARKDGAPTEIEAALCGAVWRATQWEEACDRLAGQREELYATIDALRKTKDAVSARQSETSVTKERDDYRKALEKIIAESDDAIAIELAHSAITPYTPWEPVDESAR